MIARPTMSATMIPAMVLGFSLLFTVWFGDSAEEFVGGAEFLGLTAIAGEVFSGMFGGFERVEGIEQRVFNGFPHSSGLPEKDSAFWLSREREVGIGPVRLLKERSTVAFAGNFAANPGGISPESLLCDKLK